MTLYSPDPYKKCKFPLVYNGHFYSGCATTQNPDIDYVLHGLTLISYLKPSWCATEVNDNHEIVAGKWGFCSNTCSDHMISSDSSKTLPSKGIESSEEPPSPRRNFARGGRHQSRHPYYTRYYGHHYG